MVIKKEKISVSEVKEPTRIEKKHNESIFAGVCAGIADYYGIDVIFLRILFSLSIFGYGFGIFMYILLCLVLPSSKVDWWNYNKTNWNY